MTDEDSPVIDFYPEEFQIDMNGKKMAWQGIALLPFIDPKRLLDAMATRYPLLSEDEKRRNAPGAETLLFSTRHPLYNEIVGRFYGKKAEDSEIKINSRTSQGLSGKVSKDDSYVPSSSLEFPFASESSGEFKSLDADESARVTYHMPVLRSAHKSMLLPGVKFAASMLDYNDVSQTRNRAERSGRTHGGVQLSRNGDRSDGQRINYAARDQQDNGRHNNGGNGYNANGAYGRGGQYRNDNNNPLAHLPPGLAAQAAQHGFVPGGPPPPFQGNGNGYGYPGQAPRQSGYGSRGGYNGYSGGQSRGGSYGYGNSNGHHGGGGGYGRGRRY
jgi:5'-3' exoribonuclease 2